MCLKNFLLCSDITIGLISQERLSPRMGSSAFFYYVHSHYLVLPHQGVLVSATILIFLHIFKIINQIHIRQKIAQYYYFAGFSLHPSSMGLSCDHMTGNSLSFAIDIMEVEAFSFLRQEITCRIFVEAQAQNKLPLSVRVIDQVIDQFGYLAPVANQSFHILMLAFNVYLSQL